MPRFFMYCRKSSEAEDRQVLSIESQMAELTRFAQKRGLTIIETFTEAKSAKAPGARPVFNSMMQRLYAGEATGILCWKLDRLARNPVDGGSIIWAMKQHDISVLTPFQTYGQSEDNVVWMYLEFGMAQKYVDDLSRNVKRGLRMKAEMGWLPSRPPLGYINQVGHDGRKIIIKDPERFEIIRKCWDLMLTGDHTPAEIRNLATTVLGLKSWHGGQIGASTIYNLFSNPFYHGSYEYPKGSGTWHVGRHTPMVTKDEFDLVQHLLGRLDRMPQNRHTFAYTGLIRCGGCGGTVTAEEKHQAVCPECKFKFAHRHRTACPKCRFPVLSIPRSSLRTYTYYHCTRRIRSQCREPAVRDTELLEQIRGHMRNLTLPPSHRAWMNRSHNRLQDGSRWDVLKTIESQLHGATPGVQRQVAGAVFKEMTLKGRLLSVAPQIPFSFASQDEVLPSTDQDTPIHKPLQQEVAGT